ncbi:hypothetical protein [Acinetobacter lwoffii]|uniref:hypothetical protein n=1 Tax=Acinetobacter lwoffii TaxID=28090 RepID=UPI003F8D96BC
MSLIEQLGGYERAKDIVTQNIKDFEEAVDEVGIHHPSFGWIVHEDLVKELLQYRREHNMYEVGDKYVMLKLWHDDLMTVVDRDLEEPCWNPRIIRHADDAEIEANRRLDL